MSDETRPKAKVPVEAGIKPAPIAARANETAPTGARRWRAWVFQVYLVTAPLAGGALLVLASRFNYFPVDLEITRSVQTFRAAWFATLMEVVSWPGYSPQGLGLVGAAGLLLMLSGRRWEAVTGLAAALGIMSLGFLLKLAVQRPRPDADLVRVVYPLDDPSFPSGHVLLYTVFFGYLIFLAWTLLKPSWGRTVALVILGGLVALVGLSRVYLGSHWASDTAGAYLLGSLWLAVSIAVYRWGKPRFFVQPPPPGRLNRPPPPAE